MRRQRGGEKRREGSDMRCRCHAMPCCQHGLRVEGVVAYVEEMPACHAFVEMEKVMLASPTNHHGKPSPQKRMGN